MTLARDAGEVAAAEADGTTALHWAVRQNDLELVGAHAAQRAPTSSAANRYGVTPLKLAAVNGDAKLLKRLLDAGGDANAAGTDGETLLMTAARGGHVDAARAALERGAEVDARERWHGQTALMWAAAQGHPAMLRELLAHGADVNARSNHEEWERQVTSEPRDKWLPPGGLTPLLFAARENCLACVPVLIEAGADVNATTPDGISPVVIALINGHFDVAGALLEAGTDPNLADYTGRTALYAAIDFNTMVEVEPPRAESHREPLDGPRRGAPRARARRRRQRAAEALGRRIARSSIAATTGCSAAARRRSCVRPRPATCPAMKLLLEHGADPTLAPTRSGITPLMAAAGLGTTEADTTGRQKTQEQAIEAIQLLLDRGLDLNAQASDGQTAVHGAAMQGYDDVIRFLAAQGAKLDTPDKDGFTPLDVALGKAGGFGFSGRKASFARARRPCCASSWPRTRPAVGSAVAKAASAPIVRAVPGHR